MIDLRNAVFAVLEGWTLPPDARKILEAAYYAPPKPEQEPVAWMYPSTLEDFEYDEKADYAYSIKMGNMITGEETVPLYTTPLKREWVGLTSEELAQLTIDNAGYPTRLTAAIEAKLKERNT